MPLTRPVDNVLTFPSATSLPAAILPATAVVPTASPFPPALPTPTSNPLQTLPRAESRAVAPAGAGVVVDAVVDSPAGPLASYPLVYPSAYPSVYPPASSPAYPPASSLVPSFPPDLSMADLLRSIPIPAGLLQALALAGSASVQASASASVQAQVQAQALPSPSPAPVSVPVSTSVPTPTSIPAPGPVSWSTPSTVPVSPSLISPSPTPPTFPPTPRPAITTPGRPRSAPVPPSMITDRSDAIHFDLLYEVSCNRDFYASTEDDPQTKIYDYPSTIETVLSRSNYQLPKSSRASNSIIFSCAVYHGLDGLEIDPITESMEAFRERLLGKTSGWLPERYLNQFAEWIEDIPSKPDTHGDKVTNKMVRLPAATLSRVRTASTVLGVSSSAILVVCAKAGLAYQDHLKEYAKMFGDDVLQFRSMIRVRLAMYEALMRALETEYGVTR